jgi:hypothetical protein
MTMNFGQRRRRGAKLRSWVAQGRPERVFTKCPASEVTKKSGKIRPTRVSGVLRWAVVVNFEWSAVIGRAGHVTYSAPGLDIGAVSNESASNLVADGLKRN